MVAGARPFYNALTWTAEQFIEDVRDRANVPASSKYTDQKILDIANQAIWSTLSLPELTNDGNRWGEELSFSVNVSDCGDSGPVKGQNLRYLLPPSCSAQTIQFITYRDANDGRERSLEHLPFKQMIDGSIWNRGGVPEFWSFRQNYIYFEHQASSSLQGEFRIYYQRRHPQMVLVDQTVGIRGWDRALGGTEPYFSTDRLYSSPLPPGWESAAPWGTDEDGFGPASPARWDVIEAQSPHRLVISDLEGGEWSPNENSSPQTWQLNLASTFSNLYSKECADKVWDLITSTLPVYTITDDRIAGPYQLNDVLYFRLSLSGQSNYCHLTHELREAAATQAAAIILRDIGSIEEAAAYDNKVQRLIAGVQNQMVPRGKNSPIKIRNDGSILRSLSRERYRRRMR